MGYTIHLFDILLSPGTDHRAVSAPPQGPCGRPEPALETRQFNSNSVTQRSTIQLPLLSNSTHPQLNNHTPPHAQQLCF